MSIITDDQSRHFFQSPLMIGPCTAVVQFIQTAKHVVVSTFFLSVLQPRYHYTSIDTWSWELANKYESATKKQNMITLGIKFELNINGIPEEIADSKNVDPWL